MSNFFALIMAGGGGTRLWPLSRQDRPKQLLALTGERSLFQVTVDRLRKLMSPDRIYCVTGKGIVDELRDSTPAVPADNFIVEPYGRDSGPAAALGIFTIARHDPNAVIAVLSADHHIADEEKFRRALNCARHFASRGYIVTLGIDPHEASTAFGYIQRGAQIAEHEGFRIFESRGFKEKPKPELAEQFFASGMYSWNAGIFVMTARQALEEYGRQQPAMVTILNDVLDHPDRLETRWSEITKLSIDYAIMEHASSVVVIPVDIGWSDVGTWSSLFEVLRRDEQGNAVRTDNDDHIHIDTHNTLIVSEGRDRVIVTIGVEDLVIVASDNAILVCKADRAQDVKKAVEALKARKDPRV
jgi:mannose-1-phosphate guanylyltransferase